MSRFTLSIAAGVAAAAALAVPLSHAETGTSRPTLFSFSFLGRPTMLLDPNAEPGDGDSLPIAYDPGTDPDRILPPAKVAVTVPGGYPLGAAAPGVSLGEVEAYSFEGGPDPAPAANVDLYGPLTAADPAAYAPGSAASACDPQPHTQVWVARLVALGLDLDMPLFVDTPTPGASTTIVFCSPTPTTADGKPVRQAPVAFAALVFWLQLPRPATPRPYTWSAQVTPLAPDLTSPSPAGTFEVRAVGPTRVTLAGPRSAATYTVPLHGRVTVAGQPLARADVFVYDPNLSDVAAGSASARTDRNGRFSVRLPISQTTRYEAQVGGPLVIPCRSASTAPGGCVSTTAAASNGAVWTVRVGP